MTMKQLEERIDQLEREVAALRADRAPKKDWWKNWVGIATDDPFMREAFQLALKYRADNRKKTQKPDRQAKIKRRKK